MDGDSPNGRIAQSLLPSLYRGKRQETGSVAERGGCARKEHKGFVSQAQNSALSYYFEDQKGNLLDGFGWTSKKRSRMEMTYATKYGPAAHDGFTLHQGGPSKANEGRGRSGVDSFNFVVSSQQDFEIVHEFDNASPHHRFDPEITTHASNTRPSTTGPLCIDVKHMNVSPEERGARDVAPATRPLFTLEYPRTVLGKLYALMTKNGWS